MLERVITRLLHIDKLRENNMAARFLLQLIPSYFSEILEDTTNKFSNELELLTIFFGLLQWALLNIGVSLLN